MAPKARLLHTPESVEVLALDPVRGVALVLRQGFRQEISLDQLVLETEETPAPQAFSRQPAQSLSGETELHLLPDLPARKARLELQHGLPWRATYILYLKSSDQAPWTCLGSYALDPGETTALELSLERFSPPWHLTVQRLLTPPPSTELLALPSPFEARLKLRLALFTREAHRLPLDTQKSPSEASLPSSTPPAPSPAFTILPPRELDLHAEKLAPHLLDASVEALYSYQVAEMERYLIACHSAGYPHVVVIHGVGKKKLYQALMTFCQNQGWRTEPLLTSPYLGGATRVHFAPPSR